MGGQIFFGPFSITAFKAVCAPSCSHKSHKIEVGTTTNDHRILRELLRAHGTVIPFGSFVKIELDVTRNFQPEQLKKIKVFLSIISDNINASAQSAKPITFEKSAVSTRTKLNIKLQQSKS